MTKSTSPSLNTEYSSVSWRESGVLTGVRFAIHRISLAQRIELTRRVKDLTSQNEFLRAGDMADQLDAALGELLARRLYVEWGLAAIEGLDIDGNAATPLSLIERGPDALVTEIADAIIQEIHLSEEERKNS